MKIPILSKRIRASMKNLIQSNINSTERVECMCKWWMDRKKHLRFSFGLLCCDSIIDEFKQTHRKLFKKRKGSATKQSKVDNSGLLAEVAKDIILKRERGEELDDEEKLILKQYKEAGK